MNTHYAINRSPYLVLAVSVACLLISSCGGGGADRSELEVGLILRGTVAIGKPVAGATIRAVCSETTVVSAPTTVGGEYQMEVPSVPCVLTATSSNGSVLRSMAINPGTVNITPFTEMIATHSGVDFSRLTGSRQAVSEYLQLIGVNGGSNPITTPFVANGAGHDAELDRLGSIIANSAPLTGIGATATNSFIANANMTMSSAASGNNILTNLAEYRDSWTKFWTKVGESDQTFGFVKGTEQFIATYSTKLADDFKQLPDKFHSLTNKQTDNLEGFVRGWQTCGYISNATRTECAFGRLSAIIVDLGYHWIGTAAITTGQVLGAPAEIALDASFTWYDDVTTSMLYTELQSGSITADDYAYAVSINRHIQGFAKEAYLTVRNALDAREAIEKMNVGIRALRRNFSGKNIDRIGNIAKLRDPFKKMIGGTQDAFEAMHGSVDNWSETDKQLFKSYLASMGEAVVGEVFDDSFVLTCPSELRSTLEALCVPAASATATNFSDNFSGASLDAKKWVVESIGGNLATLAWQGSYLEISVPGGSCGYCGISDGLRFRPQTDSLTGDFVMELSAEEIARASRDGTPPINNIQLLLFGATAQAGIYVTGDVNNNQGNPGHTIYAFYSNGGAATYPIVKSLTIGQYYAFKFRIRRAGGVLYLGYMIPQAIPQESTWNEVTVPSSFPSATVITPSIVVASGDGGGTRVNSSFKARFHNFTISK